MVTQGQVRLAHIGLNHTHAHGFLQSLLLVPEVKVIALYDPDPVAARALIEGVPAALDVPLYEDLALLFERERPEAVLITLPNDATPAAIVQAAEAGAHVYAEKPCARTAAEFAAAALAVRETGVQFSTGYLRRFSPAGRAIKEIVDQGLLGRLASIEARWITTSVDKRDPGHYLFSRERSGGGILHWLGCHWLDFMRWVSSAEVSEVSAILGSCDGAAIDVEDTAVVALRYQGGWAGTGGMLGSLHCSYVTDQATDQLFFGLRGTLGWIYWGKSGPEFVAHSAHPAWRTAPTRVFRYEAGPAAGYGGAQGIVALQAFIAAFRQGAPPSFTTDDALRVLQVLDAAHESASTGRRVILAQQ
jgi:predicted dehydrogenase